MFTILDNQSLLKIRKKKSFKRDYKALIAVSEFYTATKALEVSRGDINSISGMNLHGNDWKVVKSTLNQILPKDMKVRD